MMVFYFSATLCPPVPNVVNAQPSNTADRSCNAQVTYSCNGGYDIVVKCLFIILVVTRTSHIQINGKSDGRNVAHSIRNPAPPGGTHQFSPSPWLTQSASIHKCLMGSMVPN